MSENTITPVTLGKAPDLSYSRGEVSLIVVAACLGWGLEFFDLMLVSLYAPSLMHSFGMSKSAMGSLMTIQLLATALGGIIFGWLADKFGRMKVLTWTILLFSISTFLVAFAFREYQLFILRFITGLGVGGEWAVGFSLLNEAWKPKRRGLMGGIVQSSIWPAFGLAILVNQTVPDWHWGFAIGVFPAFVALWIRKRCPESKVWVYYTELKAKGELPEELSRHAKHSTFWQIFQSDVIRFTVLGTVIVFGGQYAFYSLSNWMPTLLVDTLHVTPSTKSTILYFGCGIALFSYILAGGLSDRLGRKTTFFCFSLLTLIAFVGLYLSSLYKPTLPIIMLWYVIFSLGIGYYGIFGAWFSELFPTRVRATGSAFAYNVGRGLASTAPYIVGLIATQGSMLKGISTGVIAVLIMLIAVPFMLDRKGRVISAVE